MINKNYVDINKKIPRITAIQSLVGGEISYRDDGNGNIKIDYLNRDEDFTPPTDTTTSNTVAPSRRIQTSISRHRKRKSR